MVLADRYAGYLPLDARRYDLRPGLTHRLRTILWVPADPAYPKWDGRLGQLTVKLQQAAAGWRRVLDVNTYVVSPDTPEPGDEGGRAFWLDNVTTGDGELRRAVVGDRVEKCTCDAGRAKLACKHVDSLHKLIEEGIL